MEKSVFLLGGLEEINEGFGRTILGNGKSSSNYFEPPVSFEKFVSNKGLQQGRKWENHLYQQIGDIAL